LITTEALSLLCNPTSKLGSITNHNPSSPTTTTTSKQASKQTVSKSRVSHLSKNSAAVFWNILLLLLLLLLLCWSVLPVLGQSLVGEGGYQNGYQAVINRFHGIFKNYL
jgi:hypothetical protein